MHTWIIGTPHRFSHKTHARVMKFPKFVQLFFNRSCKHCADKETSQPGMTETLFGS
jgi:hypothetical protein